MKRTPLTWLCLSLAMPTVLAGCGFDGLSFIEDDRLSITRPEARSEVNLPITVAWEIEDFSRTGRTNVAQPDAGYFALFVDRAPQAPGRTVESLAEDDAACALEPDCPNADYFATRGVYTTSQTSLTIDTLRDLTDGEARDFHEVTIVLLNGEGKRIGESAFRVEFEVTRDRR